MLNRDRRALSNSKFPKISEKADDASITSNTNCMGHHNKNKTNQQIKALVTDNQLKQLRITRIAHSR